MEWSVAIFSSRETVQTLSSSISAILEASKDFSATIDIVVNGDRALADDAGRYAKTIHDARPMRTLLRVWYLPVADKAHAWNQYLHCICPSSDIGFFVDGYAQVLPDAMRLLGEELSASKSALAASGVPTIGRSARGQAERMLRSGGIHGNLHAVRGSFLTQLRAAQFRLPLGLYRVDGVLGAVICFALDPAKFSWDSTRIFVHPQATWTIDPLKWKNLNDIRSHLKKTVRQAQGDLENLAVREHLAVQGKSPQSLPPTSAELVLSWMEHFPETTRKTFLRNPLCFFAARNLRRPRDWSLASVLPLHIAEVLFE